MKSKFKPGDLVYSATSSRYLYLILWDCLNTKEQTYMCMLTGGVHKYDFSQQEYQKVE